MTSSQNNVGPKPLSRSERQYPPAKFASVHHYLVAVHPTELEGPFTTEGSDTSERIKPSLVPPMDPRREALAMLNLPDRPYFLRRMVELNESYWRLRKLLIARSKEHGPNSKMVLDFRRELRFLELKIEMEVSDVVDRINTKRRTQ